MSLPKLLPHHLVGLPGRTWRPLTLEGYAAENQMTNFIRQHPQDTAVKYAHNNHKVIITLQKG